jgi:hypothetical protein
MFSNSLFLFYIYCWSNPNGFLHADFSKNIFCHSTSLGEGHPCSATHYFFFTSTAGATQMGNVIMAFSVCSVADILLTLMPGAI